MLSPGNTPERPVRGGFSSNLCTKQSSFTNNKITLFFALGSNVYPLKTGLYSVLYAIASNVAICLCFVPFLFLCRKKIRQDKVYIMIGIYWLANGLVNIPSLNLFGSFANQEFRAHLIFLYSLLDTPLVLAIFFFATKGKKRKIILLTGVLFTVEAAILNRRGYNFGSASIIIGIGLVLVLLFSVSGILEYMNKVEHSDFETCLVFIYAALLFAYGGFIIIYIFSQLHDYKTDNADSLLLYYISLSLSAFITSLGLWGYGIRRPAEA